MTAPCPTELQPLRVLALGAGVQSSTLAMMMQAGEIERADIAIFADTCAEPEAVYHWLSYLLSKMGMPFAKVQHGDGLTAALEQSCRGEQSAPLPPLFTINPDGTRGMLRRVCTERFKIRPLRHKARGLMARNQRCILIRGISADEVRRATPSPVKWVTHEHPLVDRNITRQDCKRWMISHGHPIPPRSACVYCPFRCNVEWQRMRDLDPASWQEACRMDVLMRNNLKGIRGMVFVHSQRVPLAEAKIEADEPLLVGQGWVDCEGMCGV